MADHPQLVGPAEAPPLRAVVGKTGRMAPRALITGITGQDGSYLAELLLDKGYEVIGLHRRSSTPTFERITHLTGRQMTLEPADLLDEASMIRVLRRYQPTEVYNLAAQSFVQTSFNQPVLTGEVTALGVTRLLDAILLTDPVDPLLPGQLQRDVRQGRRGAPDRADAVLPAQPLRGRQALRPLDHGQLPGELRPARHSGILFNHESPRRGLEFVTRKITFSRGGHQAGPAAEGGARQPGGPAGLGLRRRLRQGHVADAPAGPARTTSWSPPARPTRSASCARSPSTTSGSTGRTTSRSTSSSSGRPRSTCSSATRPRRPTSLGWKPEVGFEELVRMMVDADLAALQV